MANKVRVTIFDDQTKIHVPPGVRMLLRRACTATLVLEKFGDSAEISLRFVDDDEIQFLNGKHRKKLEVTDVLSFPMGENGNYDTNLSTGAKILGDIVISLQRASKQAVLYQHSIQRELAFLTVHSMFHLLGYDHENDGQESARMREKEEIVLTQLGLLRSGSYRMDL